MAAADAREMAAETARLDQMEREDMSDDEDEMLIGNSEDEGDSNDDEEDDDQDIEEDEDINNLLLEQRQKFAEGIKLVNEGQAPENQINL